MAIRTTLPRTLLALSALAALALPAPAAAASAHCSPAGCRSYGPAVPLGNGAMRTYAELDGDRPLAVGLSLTGGALDGLPTEPNDGHHCFDRDGDGTIDLATECSDGHENVLALPPALHRLPGMPLRWALVNWNPMGHGPVGVYDRAHFDVHFYLQPKAERDAIRPGPCMILVDCADFATATEPLAPDYLPQDYTDRHLVEPAMGNHLVDPTGPEWHGIPFTRTFIYGAYGARITFLEPMIAVAALDQAAAGTAPGDCSPVKQPAAWQQPGWYPRQYCVRYRPATEEYTVSLEDFARG
ncbi:hypothetical protein ABT095_07425 [Kitasatospora sp. NPDC002227]|uniref:hypothetical protein n=1 Tax=Kitasatospora sp. NPDC002227 TaxID=3154773 RepID=UPI003324694D